MTHRILTEHPKVREVKEGMKETEAAQAKFLARRKQEQADYETAREEWRIARERALIVGDPVPDPPTPPESATDEARFYMGRLADGRQRRRDVHAEIAPEIEASASEREADLLERARPLIDQLAEVAAEVTDLLDVVRQVSTAEAVADGITPETRRRFRHTVSVSDLVAIVSAGGRPLDPVSERKVARLAGPRPGEM